MYDDETDDDRIDELRELADRLMDGNRHQPAATHARLKARSDEFSVVLPNNDIET